MPKPRAYSVHPSVAHVQSVVANLTATTGRSLSAWLRLLKAKGPRDLKLQRDWLKAQGLGTQQAALVAERAMGGKGFTFDDSPAGYLAAAADYVERQYAGKRAALRSLYELVLDTGLAIGPEAKACPCQTMVPLFRSHVFAQIKPAAGRIDLGLALGDPAKVKGAGARLLETGGFAKKDRITHRLALSEPSDVDAGAKRWLSVAYQRDG